MPNVFNAQAQQYGLPNFNLGLTLKPLPNGSVYVAYATSSNPVGAEFDGTSAQYGGLAPIAERQPQSDIRAGEEQGDRDRHQVGAVRPSLAGDGGAVPDREGKCARIAERQQRCRRDCRSGLLVHLPPGSGNVSCISAGAAYRIRGIDLGVGGKITDKWSVFGGLVLMQSEVTKSLIPSAQPLIYPTNVGLPLANIAHQSFSLLTKYQLTDVWEIGGQAVYRSEIYGGTFLAANQGTSMPSFWRFDAFAEAKVDKNWTAKLFVNNISNKLYYDALYQSATPFVFVAPGRSVSVVLSARF